MEWLEEIDRSLFLFLNGLHASWLDPVMEGISSKYFGIPFYILGIYLLIKKYGVKTGIYFTVAAVLVVVLADKTSVYWFKNVVQRYRPSHNLELEGLVYFVNDYKGGQFGFVSSHAANMFGIATFMGLALNRKVLYVALLLAALIAYSRIYLGVHYPSDIVAGGILGAFIGLLMFRFMRNLCLKPVT